VDKPNNLRHELATYLFFGNKVIGYLVGSLDGPKEGLKVGLLVGLTVVGLAVGFAPPRRENSAVVIMLAFDDNVVILVLLVGATVGTLATVTVGGVGIGAADGTLKGVDPFEVQVHINVHSFC